jgi:hypothetical protein
MLAVSGVSLVALSWLVLLFAFLVTRHREGSFWASETGVLVFLAPAVMLLLAAGGICLAMFWTGGGPGRLSGLDIALSATAVVLVVLLGRFTSMRMRAPARPSSPHATRPKERPATAGS